MDNLDEKKIETPEEDNSQNNEDQSKRHAEMMEWSRAEVEKYRTIALEEATKNAHQDAWSLLELHKKDPKLAKEVADWFNFDKHWGYDNFIKNDWKDTEMKGMSEDEFDKRYTERRAKEEHEKALKKAGTIINKLEGDLKEKADAFFNNITEWKTLTNEQATEFAEMATLYVNRDNLKSGVLQDGLTSLWSTGVWNSKKSDKESKTVIRNWKIVDLNSNKQN